MRPKVLSGFFKVKGFKGFYNGKWIVVVSQERAMGFRL